MKRLAFILRARTLDFSLDEIGGILALRENGNAPCYYVTELVKRHINEIDAKIAALNQLRRELTEIQRIANSVDADAFGDDCICHLIQ